jgi:hypothetical protein
MAKCFTIRYGSVTPYIDLAKDGTVWVGEEGRSRQLVRVRPPNEATLGSDAFGLPVLESVPGDGVIILIRDHSGFRGGWWLAEYATHWCSRNGEPIAWDSHCPECGAGGGLMGGNTQHRLMPANDLEPDQIGKVIAHGYRAQGDAGRMGGGSEYLLRCRPGTKFSIRRTGRLYGHPAVFNVEVGENSVIVTNAVSSIADAAASAAW